MINGALLKDALREIRRNPARFLSILAIVAIGAGLFVGIKAAAPDMKYTADQYYDRQNMMDVRVLSTLGLVQDDIDAVAANPAVETVQPGYFVDATATVNSNESVFRIHSLPAQATDGSGATYVTMPRLVSGRMPVTEGECVIEANRNLPFPKEVGDTITLASGTATDLTTVLKHRTFTIVGKVVSPYYLTFDHGSSDIGGGKVNQFMMVGASEFLYPVYTEALVTLKGAKAMDSYSTEYSALVTRVVGQLENLGVERASLRLDSIKEDAQAKLDQGKAELAEKQALYDSEVGAAEAKLAAANDQLVSGRATLAAQRQSLATQISTGTAMIAQMDTQVSQAQATLNSSTATYRDSLDQVSTLLSQADQVKGQLQSSADLAGSSSAALQGLLDDPNLTDAQRVTIQGLLSNLNGVTGNSTSGLADLNALLDTATGQVTAARAQLNSAQSQLNSARAKLTAAKRDLASAQSQGQAKFAAAETSLAEGQAQYDAGKADLDAKKASGAEELAAAQAKVSDAQDQIDRLAAPTWYVLDRSKLYSYADYAATADRMDALAALFPVFFFAVAALVCLTTLTRMVDEQRTSIGTYKALGYSQPAIAFKYTSYAASASLIGGALGVVAGINLFPKLIFDSWAMMYELPPMEQVGQLPLLVGTVLVSILLTAATAFFAVRSELSAVPASLMRPKAPVAGKVILMERIPALWRRLSFSQKVTMRNIFRYKKRFFMTVIGVAGCAALLVAGLGLSDSIGSIVPRQYGEIFKQDISLRFAATSTQVGRNAIMSALSSDSDVGSTLEVGDVNATVKGTKSDISASLVVPIDAARFTDFVSLRTRDGQVAEQLTDSGAVISEKMASELGVSVGDLISVDRGTGVFKKIEVTGIAENYIFHYIFMKPTAYQDAFGSSPAVSGVFVKMLNHDPGVETALGTKLIGIGQVASVSYFSDAIVKFRETIKSLNTIVWAMVVSAGLLAFVVLFNLTIINLSERAREIATIKVLGFYNREVASYIYRENIILTIIGALAGLLVGVALHRTIMVSIEQDNVMFGNYVSPLTFVAAFALTLVFGIAVSVFTYRRLIVVKMVESLKSVE